MQPLAIAPDTIIPGTRARRRAWLVVIPILLLTTWLGARGLNADALWYDEWLSVFYAGGAQYGPISTDVTWARVAERSTWPPGFQSALAGWGALVGWEHYAARAFPLLAGVLAVAYMYRLGRDMVAHRVGVSAAVLLGASAFFAHYLHELRGYTLYALFSAMCVWAYWRMQRGRAGWGVQATLFVSVVGLLYTHYFATLTAVAVALYHLLFVPKTRGWWRVPLLMGSAALLFLPWVGIAFSTAQDALLSETRRIVPLGFAPILATLVYSFSNASVALLALVTLYSLRFGLTPARRRVLLMAWLWVGCVLGIALGANERLRVIFHIRHLMAAWAAMSLVGALGIEALARAGVRPALILLIWMAAGVWNTLDPAFIDNQPGAEKALNWDSYGAVLRTLDTRGQETDALLYHVEPPGREWLTEPIVDYYSEALPMRHTQLEQIPGEPDGSDSYLHNVDRFIADAPLVWMVVKPDAPSPYHLAEFERFMDSDYAACGRVLDFPDLTLDLYTRQPRADQPPAFRFGDAVGMTLLQPLPASVDATLDVLLGWQVGADVPPDTYSYGLHVVNANGDLVAQADAGLPSDVYSCRTVSVDMDTLPPGDYTLMALVYNWQTSERLAGVSEDEQADRVTVGRFTVE